jgi:hypothetical protein
MLGLNVITIKTIICVIVLLVLKITNYFWYFAKNFSFILGREGKNCNKSSIQASDPCSSNPCGYEGVNT